MMIKEEDFYLKQQSDWERANDNLAGWLGLQHLTTLDVFILFLTLWHNIDRRYIAMGAAGWQICFDVLECWLDGGPIGRAVGPEVMKFEGWQRLHADHAKQFQKGS